MTGVARSEPLKVSVVIVTYNQAAFIEQAVRSALAQETSFTTEVIVADDASTDGTRQILERLAAQHDAIRLVTHDSHVGVHQNCLDGYLTGTGQYLAMLNGDDYWISPYKLQRQVNFLERHAECAICFHNVLTVHDQGDAEALACSSEQKEFSGVEDLLVENFIATSSVMYRDGLMREFPDWVRPSMTWDWALHLYHTQYGRIGYLPDTMAVTRRHAGGLWNGASARERSEATVAMLEQVNRHFQRKYDATIKASIARWRQLCTFEQLRQSVKRLEGEWMRRIEQMQMDRAVAVNELRSQYQDTIQDRARLEERLEAMTREKDRLAGDRELAMQELKTLRKLVEEQGRALADLRGVIEATSSRGDSVTEATLRSISTVDERLSDIYRWVDVQRTRDLVQAVVPEGGVVLIVSKGDAELLRLDGRQGWHFPQAGDPGTYAGAHPRDSIEATERLEEMRARGAEYLVFPASSLWWLDHYVEFREHLEACYETLLRRDGACVIFGLAGRPHLGAESLDQPSGALVS
jgi:hypothetical protein